MNPAIAAELKTLGSVLTPAMFGRTAELYAPLVPAPVAEICAVERDLPYGPEARHRLDVFYPPVGAADARAVIVFVHGGGFVMGDKGGAAEPFYNNVGAWAAANGHVGVTINYRLAPGAPWPAGAEDLAAAVDWLVRHAASYGGDPARIVVMGQSAGAVHVASYIAGHHGPAAALPVAGAIMLSGIYDLTRLEHSPFEQAYFGTDASRFAGQSSLAGLTASPVPCLFTVSEFDPQGFQMQAAHLVAAYVAARGVWPRMLYLAGQNHMSPIFQLTTPGDRPGDEINQFITQAGA
jgi:triacylglycerol lipase